MKQTNLRISANILLGVSLFGMLTPVLFMTGCGKHEAAGGAFGAATGAVVGNVVSGGRSKGAGTLIGAALGHYVGSSAGRSADDQERNEKIERANSVRVVHVERTARSSKWCQHCHHRVGISHAVRCPDCGDNLVYDKYCRDCRTVFPADSSYQYCPYCEDRVRLVNRY